MAANPTLGDDLLQGAEAIAEYLDIKKRRVFYLVGIGAIPVTRLGRLIVARKSELDRALRALAE